MSQPFLIFCAGNFCRSLDLRRQEASAGTREERWSLSAEPAVAVVIFL